MERHMMVFTEKTLRATHPTDAAFAAAICTRWRCRCLRVGYILLGAARASVERILLTGPVMGD